MNKTGKPINIAKYPLIAKMYNLVRDIDSLPSSTEATYLVIKAGELMDDVWNYLESHQPKARLAGLLRDKLEAEYKGKKIHNPYAGVSFVVEHIEVTPDGPDPQMNIRLSSKRFKETSSVWREWQLKNNPTGDKTPPPEIQGPWQEAMKELFCMNNVDDALPEIVP